MKYSDPQFVFDVVVEHLARQKVRATMYKDNIMTAGCSLRGDNNTKCAVGCLIPDSDYTPDMENDSAVGPLCTMGGVIKDWFVLYVDLDLIPLLTTLQGAHDRGTEYWATRLETAAITYNLIFNKEKFEENLADLSYT